MKKSISILASPLLLSLFLLAPIKNVNAGSVTVINSTTVVQPTRTTVTSFPNLLLKKDFRQSKVFGTNIDALVGLGDDGKLYILLKMFGIGSTNELFSLQLIDAAGNTFGYLNPEVKKFSLGGRLYERYAIKLHPEIIDRLASLEIIFEKNKEGSEEKLVNKLRQAIRDSYPDGSAKRFGQFSYVLSPIPETTTGSTAATGDDW